MVASFLFETFVRYLPKPRSLNISEGKRLFLVFMVCNNTVWHGMVRVLWYSSYGGHVYDNVMEWSLEQTDVS